MLPRPFCFAVHASCRMRMGPRERYAAVAGLWDDYTECLGYMCRQREMAVNRMLMQTASWAAGETFCKFFRRGEIGLRTVRAGAFKKRSERECAALRGGQGLPGGRWSMPGEAGRTLTVWTFRCFGWTHASQSSRVPRRWHLCSVCASQRVAYHTEG